jgi:ribonucleoside-diphosphate reductase alpha chain
MKMNVLSENALKITRERYFMDDEKEWFNLAMRLATHAASVENGQRTLFVDSFAEMINEMDFLPGGRILRNIGRPRGSLFNCYVLPCGDSIEEIGQYIKDSLILWSEGGGVGVNISHLRPRGAIIRGKGGTSSGPVSFLEASNAVSKTIESGGSRRAAALACMNVSHPDILEFIDAKLVHGKLDHFNLSVAVGDKFLEAVEAESDWKFTFAQQDYGKIEARTIWDKIIENMVTCAEPGLLHWGNLTSNNSYYFDPILSTNPCGEVPLAGYGVCDLGSLVLPNFITGNVNTNWKKLERVIKLAVRFLDNIIDINKYVLKEIDIKAHNARRIGLGVMGLAEYLFAKKLRYGSKKAIYEVERLMRFIRDTAYEASVELAIEKGAFPKFDSAQYGKAHFVRSLPASLRMQIKKHGTRNVTLMAMAPTGTISLLPEVTSGVEPLFRKAYRRSDRVSDRIYVHPLYEKALTEGAEDNLEWFVDTDDLKPEDHFETQVAVQKFTDGAVSKTINMPAGTTTDALSKLTLEYIYDLKGVTVYVDGSREGQILNKITEEEVKQHLEAGSMDSVADKETVVCATGSCEI